MTTDEPSGLPPLDPPLPEQLIVGDLAVRMWREEDAPALGAAIAANAEHLRPFMDWIAHEPTPRAQREERIAGWARDRAAGGDAVYAILRGDPLAGGQVVGGTGLHRRIGPDGLEIGYWLAESEQGRGTMTRVVAALTEVALAHPMITHVEIHMDSANMRSAAVPERVGYRLVGEYDRTPTAPAETGRGMVWRYP